MTQPDHIFIGGSYRSGTDLLRNVLNSTEHMAICGETHYLGEPGTLTIVRQSLTNAEAGSVQEQRAAVPGSRQYLARIGDLSSAVGARRVVDYLYDEIDQATFACWRWMAQHVNREEFLRRLLATDRSERAFFDLVMTLYAGGKPIRGEKTPAHIHSLPTLLEWFPNARFVHMFRDPRAIFLSQKTKKAKQVVTNPRLRLFRRSKLVFEVYMGLSIAIHWLRVVQLHYQYQQRYPDNYWLLKFEDLILDPEPRLRELCNFLDVDFRERMLQRRVVNSSFTSKSDQPIQGFDPSAINRWQGYVHPATKKWFAVVCRKHLLEFGYPV